MAMTDQVGVTTLTTPSDREVVIVRVVDAPRKRVWDAWTKPEHVKNWLVGFEGWTMPVCEIDLRPGGKWHFVWRKSDGAEMAMTGVYKEVVPPERLVNTERWGPEWPETVNTLPEETIGLASDGAKVRQILVGQPDVEGRLLLDRFPDVLLDLFSPGDDLR